MPSEASTRDHVSGWATDLGLRLDPSWQVGGAYTRASGDYQQNGLEGDAYGSQVDSYMHRAFVDVIWRY